MLERRQSAPERRQNAAKHLSVICVNCKKLAIQPFLRVEAANLYAGRIDPDREISSDEIAQARREVGYLPGTTNIVVTDNLNAGRPSLINEIRNRTIHGNDYAIIDN